MLTFMVGFVLGALVGFAAASVWPDDDIDAEIERLSRWREDKAARKQRRDDGWMDGGWWP